MRPLRALSLLPLLLLLSSLPAQASDADVDKAGRLYQAGNRQEAKALLTKLVGESREVESTTKSGLSRALIYLASIETEDGANDEAIEHYEQALDGDDDLSSSSSSHFDAMLNLASLHYHHRRDEVAALRVWRQAVSKDPQRSGPVRKMIASILLSRLDDDQVDDTESAAAEQEAMEHLRAAISLDPADSEAAGNLAALLIAAAANSAAVAGGSSKDGDDEDDATTSVNDTTTSELRALADGLLDQLNSTEHDEARKLDLAETATAMLDEAVALAPGDRDLRFHLAGVLNSIGEADEAKRHLVAIAEADPDDRDALFYLGEITYLNSTSVRKETEGSKKKKTKEEEAAVAAELQEAATWFLKAYKADNMHGPTLKWLHKIYELHPQLRVSAPRKNIQSMFDSYAAKFDEHLVGRLEYVVPTLIRDALFPAEDDDDDDDDDDEEGDKEKEPKEDGGAASSTASSTTTPSSTSTRSSPTDMLDLGCGTGLLGESLREHVTGKIYGVDLSAKMLEQARARRGVYDEDGLAEADIFEHLDGPRWLGATPAANRVDLVTAGDVLVYFGDLSPVLRRVAGVLNQHGRFAFTVERVEGEDDDEEGTATAGFEITISGRHAHRVAYVRELAGYHGFDVIVAKHIVPRIEYGQDVKGALFVLQLKPDRRQ